MSTRQHLYRKLGALTRSWYATHGNHESFRSRCILKLVPCFLDEPVDLFFHYGRCGWGRLRTRRTQFGGSLHSSVHLVTGTCQPAALALPCFCQSKPHYGGKELNPLLIASNVCTPKLLYYRRSHRIHLQLRRRHHGSDLNHIC